jgi:hypothetical protein
MSLVRAKVVVTIDPENIKTILATKFNDFGKGDDFHANFNKVYLLDIALII